MSTFLIGCIALFLFLSVRNAPKRGGYRLRMGETLFAFIVFVMTAAALIGGLWVGALIVLPVLLGAFVLRMIWSNLPRLAQPHFRTRYLEMAVDMRSGHFRAHVLGGKHTGADLNIMQLDELLGLFDDFADDAESLGLLAAYLDRRFPRWREHAHPHPHARQAGAGGAHALREEEAYEILGLQKGASVEEIGEAHRRLMKRLHPDAGGTTWLAAKLNAAKDLLVETHYKNSTRRT